MSRPVGSRNHQCKVMTKTSMSCIQQLFFTLKVMTQGNPRQKDVKFATCLHQPSGRKGNHHRKVIDESPLSLTLRFSIKAPHESLGLSLRVLSLRQ